VQDRHVAAAIRDAELVVVMAPHPADVAVVTRVSYSPSRSVPAGHSVQWPAVKM
jgi:hypothetical protein